MVKACIICHETKPGAEVEDTLMLRSLRRLKADFAPVQILWGKPTGNTLVVCSECMEKFQKKRKSYEGKVLLHVLLSAGLLVFIIVLPIIGGTFTFGSLLVGLVLGAMLLALPLLDYVPPLGKEETAQKTEQVKGWMQSLSAQARDEQVKAESSQSSAQHYEPPMAPTASKPKAKTTARSREKKSKTAAGRRR